LKNITERFATHAVAAVYQAAAGWLRDQEESCVTTHGRESDRHPLDSGYFVELNPLPADSEFAT